MFRSTSVFDRLLDKAASNLLLEPDWNATLNICDYIRQGDIQPKYAINAIKKKIFASNPHVNLYALLILESCMKNCGTPFHQEVATRSFMNELHNLVTLTSNEEVREKILELIQTWAYVFRKEPNYRVFLDTYDSIKSEGYKFPLSQAALESDAMFVSDAAPQWVEGDCCHRCRVQFTVVQRKHHCRHCGQVFCGKCSKHLSTIPKYGIEKPVRVCDACLDRINKPEKKSSPTQKEVKTTVPASKTKEELQEEQDLLTAIALSRSEAELKEKRTQKYPSLKKVSTEINDYLDHQFPSTETPVPSAPHYVSKSISEEKPSKAKDCDIDGFLESLKSAIEIFVNRLNSNQTRGRPIANDTAVQSLFLNITNMHSQLLKYLQEQEDQRILLESLQDKLSQIRDARAALDALREEHQEKLRLEAEEAERQRQQQMQQKLEIMRKKKQEYLHYQKQMALQRIQDQEREMMLRQVQHKYMWPGSPSVNSSNINAINPNVRADAGSNIVGNMNPNVSQINPNISVNSNLNQNTPNMNTNITSTMNQGINPNINPINPVINPAINPNINPTINPAINPVINPTINPVIDSVIGANMNSPMNIYGSYQIYGSSLPQAVPLANGLGSAPASPGLRGHYPLYDPTIAFPFVRANSMVTEGRSIPIQAGASGVGGQINGKMSNEGQKEQTGFVQKIEANEEPLISFD